MMSGTDGPSLHDLLGLLEELEQSYQEWVAPINQTIHERMFKVNRDGYTGADFDRDVEAVREQQRAKYDPYQEMYELFDRLCPAYLEATPRERSQIRRSVADKSGILSALLGYTYRAAKRIRAPADREWLRWGLAAVSIENCSRDFRDTLLALAELYVSAEEAGLKPRTDFRAISRLSSDEKATGRETPMKKILSRFHSYGALKERRRRGTQGKMT
jgi:hypothetical protein